jgi:hypothetical protein
MTDQEFRLQIAEVVGTWVAAISVVIGGMFGIYQYMEHKAAVRVDRTMRFVERYHGNSMLVGARLTITESMVLRAGQINQLLLDTEVTPDELSKRYDDLILQQVIEDKLAAPLEQLFTFYQQILLCREMELCEEKVAAQFFDTDAKGFVLTYYPYICNIRKEWHNPNQYRKVTQFYSGKILC